MFKTIKENYQIENAMDICAKDLGIHVRRMWQELAHQGVSDLWAGLRQMIDEGMQLYETAVLLATPYVGTQEPVAQERIYLRILMWHQMGWVKEEVFRLFEVEGLTSGRDWADKALAVAPNLQEHCGSRVPRPFFAAEDWTR